MTFKAVLVDWSEVEPPEWMPGQLAGQGVEYTVARSITPDALVENAGQAQAVVLGGDVRVMTADNMDVLPMLIAIVRMGSGVDDIDVGAATARGILVVNVPQAVSESVSDHAVALLLAAVRKIPQQDRLVKRGVWSNAEAYPGRHLRGATLGLIGFGRIARAVAGKLAGFEMNVLVYDPLIDQAAIQGMGAGPVALEELLARADLVSIHCPLTESTRGLIGERELRMMRPEAILVNTSRGAVVDELALTRALREGWIAGAALDVMRKEPPDADNPLLELDNVILSPHLASRSDLFPIEIWRAVCQSLADLAAHRWPVSVVNRDLVKPRWPLN